jgi:hypothetical protein
MAVSSYAAGTVTLGVGTASIVGNITTTGVFQFCFDTVNLADGDVLEARIYQMPALGGTARVEYFHAWYGAQPTDDLGKASVPFANAIASGTPVQCELKQTFGTGRNVPYTILQVAS